MRADARGNRERIVEVARRALAEDPGVSMNRIAQDAGVGPGTLYRNFATREDLVLEVYRAEVADLVRSAPDLLAATTPLFALERWTTELVAAMRRKHGLGDALSAAGRASVTEETYAPVLGAIDSMLRAGQADGTIRQDADARDFLQLTSALWRAASGPEDRSGAMLALVLDGLAAR